MALSFREVAEILKLIDASECDELILELEGTKLMVRRHGTGDGSTSVTSGNNPAPVSEDSPSFPDSGAAISSSVPVAKPVTAEAEREDGLIEIRAPMVGTFYRAPSPSEPVFVEVGDEVKVGDPVCLIEVMKLYTTIEAQQAGRIVQISAENGTLVEYDQPLFVIEPVGR